MNLRLLIATICVLTVYVGSSHWGKLIRKPAQQKIENPFLYRLSKDGKVSYLFGSQHLGISGSQLPESVWQALKESPNFMAEDLVDDEVKPELSKVARFEKDILFANTQSRMRIRGIDLNKFSKEDSILKVCIQYIYADALPKWAKLDEELTEIAKKMKKMRWALDEASDMTEVLVRSSKVCDLNQLAQNLSPEMASHNYWASQERYIRGQEELLIPDQNSDLWMKISVRNSKWLGKIGLAHKSGGAFITVGALHLGGPKGLLNLLKAQGFEIVRFPYQSETNRLAGVNILLE